MTSEQEDRKYEEWRAKGLAYYQACLNGWLTTKMEADKQVLTLSGLAIGLLMSIHAQLKTCIHLATWSAAGVCFLLAIGLMLRVFLLNAKYLSAVKNEEVDQPKTDRLDWQLSLMTNAGFTLFFLGALATSVLAFQLVNIKY